MSLPIKHLSISSFNSFYTCPEAWRRRYIEGEKTPPGISARIGTGVHEAAEVNYRQKIESGEDLPLADILDAASTAYDKAVQEGVHFAPEDLPAKDKIIADGKDTTITLAKLYAEKLAPTVQPLLVEQKFSINLPGLELPVMAIIDLFTKDGDLRDLKTSAKKWEQAKADLSPQLTLYREVIKQHTGSYPARMGFDVLVGYKRPKLQQLATTRFDHDIFQLELKIRNMLSLIKDGTFYPAPQGSKLCSPKWCGYWESCKWGGDKPCDKDTYSIPF